MTTSSAKTPFPLGAYLNAPDGSTASNQAEFQTNYDSFTALMGTSPSFLDYYSDYNQQAYQPSPGAGGSDGLRSPHPSSPWSPPRTSAPATSQTSQNYPIECVS